MPLRRRLFPQPQSPTLPTALWAHGTDPVHVFHGLASSPWPLVPRLPARLAPRRLFGRSRRGTGRSRRRRRGRGARGLIEPRFQLRHPRLEGLTRGHHCHQCPHQALYCRGGRRPVVRRNAWRWLLRSHMSRAALYSRGSSHQNWSLTISALDHLCGYEFKEARQDKTNLKRFFSHALTIAEAKYWDRPLNDTVKNDALDSRDATAQLVKYLDDVWM